MSQPSASDLVQQRGNLKARLTRIVTFVSTFQPGDNIQKIKARMPQIEEIFRNFLDVQAKIELLDNSPDSMEAHEVERANFESKYYDILAEINTINEQSIQPQINLTQTDANNCTPTPHVETRRINLPPLKLKPFSGSYKDWLSFHNSFTSVIDDMSNNLTDCQRLQYLRSCLCDEALLAIENLSLSDANYKVAWDILQGRFKITRLIVNDHIRVIAKLPNIHKTSHAALRSLVNTVKQNMSALETLKLPIHSWDALMVYLIEEKLDFNTIKEWQATLSNDVAKFDDLIAFLEKRCQFLESLDHINNRTIQNPPNFSSINKQTPRKGAYHSHVAVSKPLCGICKADTHMLYQCPEFLKLSIANRFNKVKQLKLCINCLRTNHTISNCNSKSRCRHCQQSHNTLLHKNQSQESPTRNKTSISENVQSLSNSSYERTSVVLLSTAIVCVRDRDNNLHECRALLDPGSMSNYITTEMCHKLKLKKRNININIGGIGNLQTTVKHSTDVHFKSKYENFSQNLRCLVLDKITGNLPIATIKQGLPKVPADISLADPSFYESRPVDILIGAQYFLSLLLGNSLNIQGLSLQSSRLGWIVGGTVNGATDNKTTRHKNPNQLALLGTLNQRVERFWEQENCEIPSGGSFTAEERACERHFTETTTRASDGRFIAKLPFRTVPPNLGSSRDAALKQFYNLEKKLNNQPELKADYVAFMREYLHLNHMEEVPSQQSIESERTYHLPHHAVLKDSTSTKLRVVFNASQKTSNHLSLNDNLLLGPTIQQDLFAILVRFRTFKYVLSGDIAKMYRMIRIHQDDIDFQRIFWREDPKDQLKTYRLTTLTYGTKPASFISTRCIHELANLNQTEYKRACEVIKRDFYVDDLLTGADSREELSSLRDEIVTILKQGGFNLRKWASNDPGLIPDSTECDSSHNIRFDKNECTKTLGLLWNPAMDFLGFEIKSPSIPTKITKRGILSMTAQVFDPLGLVGPVIIKAKLIIQQLWATKLDWDTAVPANIQCAWINFLSELPKLNDLKIPRNIISLPPTTVEIHGFCDASQVAYGAAIYVRVTDKWNNHKSKLICAKSRVAPLKVITLPRLELSAALLLARLAHMVLPTLNIAINKTYFWTDSTIVLAWINSESSHFQTFVSNRISEITQLTATADWHHVRSADNPADVLSRGASPSELKVDCLWWNGPSWLAIDQQEWPVETLNLRSVETPERRLISLASITEDPELPLLTKFSSFGTTQRVMAWVMRFINNCRSAQKIQGELSVEERNNATNCILKLIQNRVFSNEIKRLEADRPLDKKSKLLPLCVFLDEKKLLRVGGRLRNSNLSQEIKHPVLLPKHHITELIIRQTHVDQLHAGTHGTIAAIRQRFWLLSARNTVRKIIHKCYRCFRAKPTPCHPLMGNLPKARCEPTRPFLVCGVDFAGPLLVKEGRGRGKRSVKAYVAVFVCFATKAVHLELVGDLTAASFTNCLSRLVSRRGHVLHIYSDNATNFKGANNQLTELKTFFKSEPFKAVESNLAGKGITWHFIPPASPHMGGIWEINVKSVKYHLKRVLGESHLTYEELHTLLTRIEGILNSRPVIPISSDPNDLAALTPGHFLIGEPINSGYREMDLLSKKQNLLTRWQRVEQIRQHFWQRWAKEYLTQHISRNTRTSPDSVKVGDLAVIVSDITPPQQWNLGRIIELHPGSDGVVRVVTMKTVRGVVKRALRKVCVLPTN